MEKLTEKLKEIWASIVLLFALGGVFEIRMLRTTKGTVSGYFDNPEAAVTAIEPYIGVNDIYITINPPDPALLSRSENKLTSYAKEATADNEITKINWVLVDIDPVRQSGTASTTEEKRAAKKVTSTIISELHEKFGFPNPVICDSGNGYHLLYQVQLENTKENRELLKNFLRALHFLYSTDMAHVDCTTYNPARIVKLWGTMACKGDDTEERPRRWSKIIQVPKESVILPVVAIQSVIDVLPTAETTASGAKKPMTKSIDAGKWLSDKGISVAFTKDDDDGGKIYVLDTCPWCSEHTNKSAYVKQFKNGALAAGCHHNSCQDESWHTLREKYEPEQDRKASDGGDDTHFEKIVNIADKKNIELFFDQKEEPHALIPVKNHTEVCRVGDGKLRHWFAREYFNETRQMFSADAWTQARDYFKGVALFEGEERRMFTRCAWVDGVLYYDLNDENKRIVRVTAEGWDIVTDYDVLFYRNKTMATQVDPIQSDCDISTLDKFYRFKNEDDRLLHKVSLITRLLSQINHPIIVVYGIHGGSKTSTLRKDKYYIDPDRCDILGIPKGKDELAILLDKHYFLCFDNITSVSSEMSDLFCLAATGGVTIKRKLYTDDDEVILELKNPVNMSGINVVATKPDLLDRSILLELDNIAPNELKTEEKMWEEFNRERPVVLGMIFTILSKAIQIFPSLDLNILGRMADFTVWGFAIAEAAGIGGQNFLDAYLRNRNRANDEAIASHPVASAVIKLMENTKYWSGNASDLMRELTAIANSENIDTKSFLWAKQPNTLSRRLNEVKTNLAQIGLAIENQNSGTRLISIRKNLPVPAATTAPLVVPVVRSLTSATTENAANTTKTAQNEPEDIGDNGAVFNGKRVVAKSLPLPNKEDKIDESANDDNYVLPF